MKDKYKHKFLEEPMEELDSFKPIVKPIKRKRVEKESVKQKEKLKKLKDKKKRRKNFLNKQV
jgi:hypothetical protein